MDVLHQFIILNDDGAFYKGTYRSRGHFDLSDTFYVLDLWDLKVEKILVRDFVENRDISDFSIATVVRHDDNTVRVGYGDFKNLKISAYCKINGVVHNIIRTPRDREFGTSLFTIDGSFCGVSLDKVSHTVYVYSRVERKHVKLFTFNSALKDSTTVLLTQMYEESGQLYVKYMIYSPYASIPVCVVYDIDGAVLSGFHIFSDEAGVVTSYNEALDKPYLQKLMLRKW